MSFIHVSATSRLLHGNTNFTTTEWEAVTRHRKSRINHPASFLVYRIIIRIIHTWYGCALRIVHMSMMCPFTKKHAAATRSLGTSSVSPLMRLRQACVTVTMSQSHSSGRHRKSRITHSFRVHPSFGAKWGCMHPLAPQSFGGQLRMPFNLLALDPCCCCCSSSSSS